MSAQKHVHRLAVRPEGGQETDLRAAVKVLSEKKDTPGIIDLSQGNPACGPDDLAELVMVRALQRLPLGKYSQEVVTPEFKIAALRYFLKRGVTLESLVDSSDPNVLLALDKINANLNHDEISGKSLFKLSLTGQGILKEVVNAIDELSIIGGTENSRAALHNAMRMFEGKYVLGARGLYHSFSGVPALVGKEWELLPTKTEENYKLLAGTLDTWCKENSDKLQEVSCLVIVDPSNPSGAVYTKEEKKAVAEVCRKHQIPVVEDIIYSGIVKDADKRANNIPMTEFYAEATLAFTSMGKYFGAPGLRVGCVVGTPALVKQFNKDTRTTTGFISPVICAAAAAALELTPQDYFDKNNKTYADRMDCVREWAEYTNKRFVNNVAACKEKECFVKANDPEGGFFVLVQFPGLKGLYYEYEHNGAPKIAQIKDSTDLTRLFIHYTEGDEQGKPVPKGVRMPPTSSTGIPGSMLELRISVGDNPEAVLKRAFGYMSNALENVLKNQAQYKARFDKQSKGSSPQMGPVAASSR